MFPCKYFQGFVFLSTALLVSQPSVARQKAPKAEYPQPKGYNESRKQDPETNKEQPYKRGRDGAYYYKKNSKKKKPKKSLGLQAPDSIGSDGTYYYSQSPETQKPTSRQKAIVDSDGTFFYQESESQKAPQKTVSYTHLTLPTTPYV